MDENRLTVLAKQHGIKQAKESDSIGKLFAAYLRRVEEGVLGRVLVELIILHATARRSAAQVLRDAAAVYKVDTDAIKPLKFFRLVSTFEQTADSCLTYCVDASAEGVVSPLASRKWVPVRRDLQSG